MIISFQKYAEKRASQALGQELGSLMNAADDGNAPSNTPNDQPVLGDASNDADQFVFKDNPPMIEQMVWSDHDLSLFFRMLGTLRRCNFDVGFFHGTTDEGDLWAVFEHNGSREIAISISRIDDIYILDNTINNQVFEGASLEEISDQLFARTALIEHVEFGSADFRPNEDFDHRKQSKKPLSNVVLHPSSGLVTFIATALLLADIMTDLGDVSASETSDVTPEQDDTDTLAADIAMDDVVPQAMNGNAPLKSEAQSTKDKLSTISTLDQTTLQAALKSSPATSSKLNLLFHEVGQVSAMMAITTLASWFIQSRIDHQTERDAPLHPAKTGHAKASDAKDDRGHHEKKKLASADDGKQDIDAMIDAEQKNALHKDIHITSPDDVQLAQITKKLLVLSNGVLENLSLAFTTDGAKDELASLSSDPQHDLSQDVLAVDELAPDEDFESVQTVSTAQITSPSTPLETSNDFIDTFEISPTLNLNIDNQTIDLDIYLVDNFSSSEDILGYSKEILNQTNVHKISASTDLDESTSTNSVGKNNVDFNMHIVEHGQTNNDIDFKKSQDVVDVLVYFGGTVSIDNFEVGVDQIFFVGPQPAYETVDVVAGDLHLVIDEFNKIVLSDFYQYDEIA